MCVLLSSTKKSFYVTFSTSTSNYLEMTKRTKNRRTQFKISILHNIICSGSETNHLPWKNISSKITITQNSKFPSTSTVNKKIKQKKQ